MKVAKFVIISFFTMLCVCYVHNRSIIAYIVQRYHYGSDMIATESSFFSFGNVIANQLEKMRAAIFESESSTIELVLPQYNAAQTIHTLELEQIDDAEDLESKDISMQDFHIKQSSIKQNVKQSTSTDSTNMLSVESNTATTSTIEHVAQEEYINFPRSSHKRLQSDNTMLTLAPQTRFLLIGDSLMQGIGMVLPRMLQQHGFRTKNIAKQSTGLTYPSFFNWEQATINAFKQYKDIGVVVVCLGANDPWNMPKKRFRSKEWEEAYKARIKAILDIAKANNAMVAWYAVPMTKNTALNKKLAYLNELYKEVVSENGGLFLKADAVLHNGEFSDYLQDDKGKHRLVRAQDGIHFTPYGSKLLAQTLIDHILMAMDE